METQKILKPKEKVVVIADYREKETIVHLKEFDTIVTVQALDVGDFVVSKRVAFERKDHSDFISSIIDSRIFEQAKTLKENFEKPIIIIEGYSNFRNMSENALKGAIASLLIDYNISLVNTKNPHDTARTIYWIAKHEQKEGKGEIAFKVGKRPKDVERLQVEIVSGLPGVSSVISKRMLEHFGSVEEIFSAGEEELREVKGIGKVLAKKIKKILTLKYK